MNKSKKGGGSNRYRESESVRNKNEHKKHKLQGAG
jgi:hypothetical protein